ncbi:MAG: aminodeoxychorismate synthase component I [Acidobacteriota bacterium]|nr:aminodeoxychorismate synthase component I [Acidobacteriota bacterium]MDH3530727.1 aminodeoxychorismate synthase component I [Acidobacteriota bacterium]
MPAHAIVAGILELSKNEPVALLDSCGASNLGSRLLIAGIGPVRTLSLASDNPNLVLSELDRLTSDPETASIITISYDFGLKLQNIESRKEAAGPYLFAHVFDSLIQYDYVTGSTSIKGNTAAAKGAMRRIKDAARIPSTRRSLATPRVQSNFSKEDYLDRIDKIKSEIRRGNTYQTNLTQQFRVMTAEDMSPQEVYNDLRRVHPAAFSAFISREEDVVVSISPERFIRIDPPLEGSSRSISSSPIKGTQKRGIDREHDNRLKEALVSSEKDIAENTMIVDLIRNDLGRVCEYGSVRVEKLCELEEHPTLFHLVSTVNGVLRKSVRISDVIKAVFPCGSITGCPKISTMKIIEDLETVPRGLSMGAIGYSGFDNGFDLNVAIRTMVFRGREAVFNVGGGIVIDSDGNAEYAESLLKAQALFDALNA